MALVFDWGRWKMSEWKNSESIFADFHNYYTQHSSRVLAFEASSEIMRERLDIYDPAFRNSKSTYQEHSDHQVDP